MIAGWIDLRLESQDEVVWENFGEAGLSKNFDLYIRHSGKDNKGI